MIQMAERRVRYQDVVPYDTPASLDALHGPAAGRLELPITVHWGLGMSSTLTIWASGAPRTGQS